MGSRLPGGRALTTFVMNTSLARQAGLRQHLVEQLPGAADERTPLLVLEAPGRLADDHHLGILGPLPRHEIERAITNGKTASTMGAYVLV